MRRKIMTCVIALCMTIALNACNGATSAEAPSEKGKVNANVPESNISLSAASGDMIASGSSNDVRWEIYENGLLVVMGSGDWDHEESDYFGPWIDNAGKITAAEVNLTDTTDVSSMFKGCNNLTTVDLSNFDTKNVVNMNCMFNDCNKLEHLDLGNLDTENVTNMSCMFENCFLLKDLNLSAFNTSNVTDMARMFFGCGGLESLDLSNFDTHNVTDVNDMFYGCSNMEKIDLSSFDTGNVEFLGGMFQGCESLKELDVSGFHTSKSKDFERVFSGCSSLESLDLGLFNFSSNKVGNRDMLEDCSGLTEIEAPIDFGTDDFYIPLPGTFYDVDSGEECTRITQENAGHTLERQ